MNFGFPSTLKQRPWVASAYLWLIASFAVLILAGGCSSSPSARIEVAPDVAVLSPGQKVHLFLEGTEKAASGRLSWEVEGVSGGSPHVGEVSSNGTYKAPAVTAPQTFVVRAVRQDRDGRTLRILATRRIFVLPKRGAA